MAYTYSPGTATVSMDDLLDVDSLGALNGDFLVYNSTTGMWEPGAAPGAGGAVNYQDFNVLGTPPIYKEGRLFYDTASGSMSYYTDQPDVTLNLNQEIVIRVTNNTGVTITNGQVLTLAGLLPDSTILAQPALATAAQSPRRLAVATSNILDGEAGYATMLGRVGSIDTSGFTPGVTLYLSDTVPGTLTPVEPVFSIPIGIALDSDLVGTLYVQTVGANSLDTLADVDASNDTLAEGQYLIFNGTKWVPDDTTGYGTYQDSANDAAPRIITANTRQILEIDSLGGTSEDLPSNTPTFWDSTNNRIVNTLPKGIYSINSVNVVSSAKNDTNLVLLVQLDEGDITTNTVLHAETMQMRGVNIPQILACSFTIAGLTEDVILVVEASENISIYNSRIWINRVG